MYCNPREYTDDQQAIFGIGSVVGDSQHSKKQSGKNGNDEAQTYKTEGFAHDCKDGVVDGLGEVAGGLDGIADTDAEKATHADGEHGVFDMIGGIGTFAAG